MKKIMFLIVAAGMILVASPASAQTASATLNVKASVSGSISCIFNSDPSGVPLTGSGTNAASLDFGNISAYGPLSPGVVRTSVTASTFTVQSAVDIFVSKANTASGNYTLKAQLAAADAVITWQVAGVVITNAAQTTITPTGTYAVNTNYPVALVVPLTVPSGTSITNTINYTCSAN